MRAAHSLDARNASAKRKNTRMEQASVMVVIMGAAISAVSSFSRFASMGRRQPSDFAMSTVQMSVRHTTAATSRS